MELFPAGKKNLSISSELAVAELTGNLRQAERILDLFPAPVLARLGM